MPTNGSGTCTTVSWLRSSAVSSLARNTLTHNFSLLSIRFLTYSMALALKLGAERCYLQSCMVWFAFRGCDLTGDTNLNFAHKEGVVT